MKFTDEDKADKLSHEKLEFLSKADSSWVIHFLEEKSIFDVNKIRLLIDLGRDSAKQQADQKNTSEDGSMISRKEIKKIALEAGFKIKEQPGGEKDLNEYVYRPCLRR